MNEENEVLRERLKQIKRIEIQTKKLLDNHVLGSYRSIFKGQGVDFEEIREYIPGDDVRSIDWNVTSKTQSLCVKKFREDRERTLLLAVDVSASLNFGSVFYSKREILTTISSILAFSAIRNNDKIGLFLFSDRIEKFIPPRKGRKHVLRILRDILFFRPESKKTGLVGACENIIHFLKKRSVVFFLSDFVLNDTENSVNFYKKLRAINYRHQLICISIRDPLEKEFPNVGWINLEDPETGEGVLVNSTKYRRHFIAQKEREEKRNTEEMKKIGVDFLELSSQEDGIRDFFKFFNCKKV